MNHNINKETFINRYNALEKKAVTLEQENLIKEQILEIRDSVLTSPD